MVYMVLEECGGCVKEIIKELGKNMLIYRVLNENIDFLEYFKKILREQGFNEIIVDIILEFKKYNVNIENLIEIDKSINDIELVQKIKELVIIYDVFNLKMN